MLCLKLRRGAEEQPMVLQKIIDSLALIPSLSLLSIAWRIPGDAGPLLREHTRETGSSDLIAISRFVLLPSLKELKIAIAYAEAPLWIDVIRARWRARGRTLESVALSECSSAAREGSQLLEFNQGDNPACLPEEWEALKGFISEGLRFESI